MQNFSTSAGRSATMNPKISAPASKAAKAKNEPTVKTGKGVAGFAGGVINPKVKC